MSSPSSSHVEGSSVAIASVPLFAGFSWWYWSSIFLETAPEAVPKLLGAVALAAAGQQISSELSDLIQQVANLAVVFAFIAVCVQHWEVLVWFFIWIAGVFYSWWQARFRVNYPLNEVMALVAAAAGGWELGGKFLLIARGGEWDEVLCCAQLQDKGWLLCYTSDGDVSRYMWTVVGMQLGAVKVSVPTGGDALHRRVSQPTRSTGCAI